MIEIQTLPHINASLNAIAMVFLIAGFALVRSGRKDAHRAVMIAATITSALFLISYSIYHANAPIFEFRGQGLIRVVYYTALISHVILAAVVAPMILLALWRAARGRFEQHRRLARWTWPVWLYVSVTGIFVYLMLYHFHPGMPA
ncbi:MAG: DUF420 domain-containing protein [Rhodospirillales bacterium]|nr:DUF420 domain-containing protein [Rhodospirillales bacterium]MCW8862433.1 DUF420 domain-containing protein [Rhodospirillales bacterium]MCW8951872.1 DUF420 domain-containing protein [Rhodospirillales bacterium]MCW8970451.1 DUF420 domain-containing protein [Rhodospirillales bacterium]MCW9003067.1 DUF420 domain-containing protein [Rhodospirillales bacterium]